MNRYGMEKQKYIVKSAF